MTQITPEERARLRALCDAATPGPWRWGWVNTIYETITGWFGSTHRIKREESYVVFCGQHEPQCDPSPKSIVCATHRYRVGFDNAEFIAASRTALPQLIDALDAAEAEIAELKQQQPENLEARIDAYLNEQLPAVDPDKLAELKRDAERWREVERLTRYYSHHSEWIVNVDRASTLAESIDASIAERKRKDGAK